MGMFDDIRYEAPCPFCGASLRAWQSKDGGCAQQNLTPYELWEQKGDRAEIEFYDNCDNCGTWVEIHIRGGTMPYTSEDFRRHRAGEPLHRQRGPIPPRAAASTVVSENP